MVDDPRRLGRFSARTDVCAEDPVEYAHPFSGSVFASASFSRGDNRRRIETAESCRFQLFSKLLTLEGLKYVIALAIFLVIGGGTIFADVQSHVGDHVSTWEGIWWAVETVSTEGTHIEATTNAARATSIVLMLTGIGVFSILTGAVSQHFIANRAVPRANELSQGENVILTRLDEIATRLDKIETG